MDKNFLKKYLVALILTFTSLAGNADVIEVDGIYYQFKSNTAIVTSGTKKYTGNIKIPGTVRYEGNTYSVIAIGNLAFYDCCELISIEIPEGVTSIGEYNQEIKGETNVKVIPVSA